MKVRVNTKATNGMVEALATRAREAANAEFRAREDVSWSDQDVRSRVEHLAAAFGKAARPFLLPKDTLVVEFDTDTGAARVVPAQEVR